MVALTFFLNAAILSALAPAARSIVSPEPANAANEGECKKVFDASDKAYDLPHHIYWTTTSAAIHGGQPDPGESISTGTTRYILYKGKWRKDPLSLEQARKNDRENREESKIISCHFLRTEMLSGDLAEVYSLRTEHDDNVQDMTAWISKGRGVMLRSESDIETAGDAKNKIHFSARYEYSNVHAPQL